ncbi:MAG: mandelate racemase/muconate lactonizing enzyme family protein [Dehalococcoidia bacterium]
MRITAVQAIPLAIPFAPWDPPTSWYERLEGQLLIRVETDRGLVGWGESFAYGTGPAVAHIVERVLAPVVVGQDPSRIAWLHDRMQRVSRRAGHYGLAMYALSGVDIALWDLAGKALGVPVAQLLGGISRPSVPAYGSHPHYATPQDAALGALKSVESGFTMIKLHQTDLASVAAVREAVGPEIDVMLDTNNPWTPSEAIAMAKQLAPYNLRWLEEPVWPPEDFAGLARVRAAATMPITLGENACTVTEFRDILAAGAADVLQPSVTKSGGLTELQRVAILAAAAGVPVIPHSFYFGPGLAATVHLVASFTGDTPMEFPLGRLATPLLREPIEAQRGVVHLPEGPGLGVEINPAVLA